MPDPTHRASDAEREATAERLRRAAVEGRIDEEELETRVAAAYAARTHGELEEIATDVPGLPAARPAREPILADTRFRQRLAGFIVTNTICIAVWAASGADGSFWPLWVLLGTGIGLYSTVVHRVLGAEDPRRGRGRHRDRGRRSGP